MKVLFTSDWQTEFENLKLCRQAVEEILDLKEQLGFGVLVHCGDLKHQYNPVDQRVTNFYLWAIDKWKKAGLEVLIDLGNHDRIGMYVDKQNWLPVFRKAGARCFDEPDAVYTGTGQICFLPYRTNPVLLQEEAKVLAVRHGGPNSVLVFHGDLKTAKYNVMTASDADIRIQDLRPQKYQFCIGGHIHMQQNVADNVWYVGSPFATDWGEANQRKGYLFVDTQEKKITRVATRMPGWFDPSWPGFYSPKTWEGARVRIKVRCGDSKHIAQELQNAREAAEDKYRGAEIIVIPDVQSGGQSARSGIQLDDPDHRKLEVYAGRTLPDELKQYREKVIAYLVEQLRQAGGLRRDGGQLTFRSVRAQNFLSFKDVEIRYDAGLAVVTGENKDRKGKSNGSGKSSFLQPIAVALFGNTFKNQKHDKWMNRWTAAKEDARVKIWFMDAQGRNCTVERGRRPKAFLKLTIEGSPVSSGNRPEDTQKMIEQVTGYTWETLANAVYVDQTRAHLMLTGTESERKEFLARLQNLERFEKALKRVRAEKSDLDDHLQGVQEELRAAVTVVSSLRQTIHEAKEILALGAPVGEERERLREKKNRLESDLLDWQTEAGKRISKLDEELYALKESTRDLHKEQGVVETNIVNDRTALYSFQKMIGARCRTCKQEVGKKYADAQIVACQDTILVGQARMNLIEKRLHRNSQEEKRIKTETNKWISNPTLEMELQATLMKIRAAELKAKEYEKQEQLLKKIRERKADAEKLVGTLKWSQKRTLNWMRLLDYAEKVFARNGLPAYLNAQLCPQLNQAAVKYSELFTQSEILVRFEVDEDGRLDVQVINATGGEGVLDQSEGEMKMASLITSFAVREGAPKTNILILDEPGHGLDTTSARQFARGLKMVVKQFGTILLTSHNPAILDELSDAKHIRIIKEKRISRMEE